MQHLFHFQTAVHGNRFEVIPRIQAAIGGAGAWVTDYRAQPGASIQFDLEAPAGDLPGLHVALEAAGLRLEPPLELIRDLFRHPIEHRPDTTLSGTLTLRFLDPEAGLPQVGT